jgi:hypothetical protein
MTIEGSNEKSAMAALREYLNTLTPGAIDKTESLAKLLADAWCDLDSGRGGGMQPYKIWGRLETVEWDPPQLNGAVVPGSSRAELQRWNIDVNKGTASLGGCGFRRAKDVPPSTRLDTRPLAREIAQLIVNRVPDSRLKWKPGGQVRVAIGLLMPNRSAAKQTVDGRRKRFRAQLDEQLSGTGWKAIRPNLYALTKID